MDWRLQENTPIWSQLHRKLMLQIAIGVYPPGSKMPTVRELALQAGVNPNTMQRALSQLELDGLVTTQRTAGRTVTEDTDLLQHTRAFLARDAIAAYRRSMAELGFSPQEARELLSTTEE